MSKKETSEKEQLQQLIIQNNAIIAEFVQGFKNPQERWYNIFPNQSGYYSSENLKYHSDWNWIMSAWFKFQDKFNEIHSIQKIQDSKYWETFRTGILIQDMSYCYNIILDGIKWYNEYSERKTN